MSSLLDIFYYQSNAPENVQNAQIYSFMVYLRNLSIPRRDYVSVPSYVLQTLQNCSLDKSVEAERRAIINLPIILYNPNL
jgi:hypothetical protein